MSCCEIGTYKHQELAFVCECCGHNVWVDRCLVDEIADLNQKKIHTVGCCCGHGELEPYIQVFNDSVDQMKKLGYELLEIRGDTGIFLPKSKVQVG